MTALGCPIPRADLADHQHSEMSGRQPGIPGTPGHTTTHSSEGLNLTVPEQHNLKSHPAPDSNT